MSITRRIFKHEEDLNYFDKFMSILIYSAIVLCYFMLTLVLYYVYFLLLVKVFKLYSVSSLLTVSTEILVV